MKIINFLRRDWLALLFLLIPAVLIIYLWPQLPDSVATHWNAAGEVDGWLSKASFGMIMSGLLIFTYSLLSIVLRIDPKPTAKYNRKTLRILRITMMGLLCVTTSAIVLFNVGVSIDIPTVTKLSVPLVLLVVGNLFSKMKPNYFMGIRTPWTLESREVWLKTHRLAGGLWVVTALFLLVASLSLPDDYYPPVLISATLVMVLVPVGYSYLIFRKQQTI